MTTLLIIISTEMMKTYVCQESVMSLLARIPVSISQLANKFALCAMPL